MFCYDFSVHAIPILNINSALGILWVKKISKHAVKTPTTFAFKFYSTYQF